MTQTKKAKNALIFGIIFSALAIFFVMIYHFNVIKSLDLFLSATYVSYFLGLALFYNASYCNERGFKVAKKISVFAGFVLVIAAIVLLSYGFATGQIDFFGLL